MTSCIPPTTIANPTSASVSVDDPARRLLLRTGVGAAMLPASAILLTACGGGDDAASSPADTPEVAAPGGAATGAAKLSTFALAVLPDTQFYSRYATLAENDQFARKFNSEPFSAQTHWVADNANTLNIPFLIHLGDIVDQVNKPEQWTVADNAMRVLENAKIPYSVLAGNHDVLLDREYAGDQSTATDAQRVLANEPYLKTFSPARAQKTATFGGRDPSGFHEFHIFQAEGQKFLVLSLSWRISDGGIAWARKVMQDNPTLPAILVNHQLLNIGADGISPLEVPYGLMLWEKLINDNDQIFMTLNGHYHGASRLTKINAYGNAVEEMVVDYQMAYQGGNGLMRLYEFDLTGNEIRVLSFSPWVPQKPRLTRNAFDQAVLTAANETFTIKMNFAKRFARFNAGFKAGQPTRTALVDQAKALILANYTDPAPAAQKPASGPLDYPVVQETVAHWRFHGGTKGTPVPVGHIIPDLAGANPISRAALNVDGVAGAQIADMVWSDDHHYLSASPGSVQLVDTDKNTSRMSYFTTARSAALNAATLSSGYTVEAFIKIAKDWTSGKQAWMNVLTRDGMRGQLPGFNGGEPESPPLLFAISSLREVQWEVVAAGTTARGAKTNWSGEIIADKWIHVAIVNDVATRETTMYIEGAPVLRNAADAIGLASLAADMPWVVGAGSWEGQRADGFFGNIGEIRIVSKPLTPTQWLTARKA
jgi:hypothetical protein